MHLEDRGKSGTAGEEMQLKKNRRKLNIQHLLPLDIAPASQTKTINRVYAMNMKKKDSVTALPFSHLKYFQNHILVYCFALQRESL